MFTDIDIEDYKEKFMGDLTTIMVFLKNEGASVKLRELTMDVMVDDFRFCLSQIRYLTCFKEVLKDMLGEDTALKFEELADKKYIEYMEQRNS